MISESVQIAFIAAVFPTVSIGISAYFNYKANKKADIKLDEIHELTNSTATNANEKIGQLHDEVTRLNKVISKDE